MEERSWLLLTNTDAFSSSSNTEKKIWNVPPIFSPLNADGLNQFEAIAFLDLIRNVSKEESLQFIVGVNSKPEVNSIIDVISTPKLSIYSNY